MSDLSFEEDSYDSYDKYILPRNNLEKERLQNQHDLLTEVFDGRLIIDRAFELKQGCRVLDSGTGPGCWIAALLKIVPDGLDIVGLDISSAMFPAEIPKDVSLHEMSILDLPSSWENSFDLAHQRLLIAAFTREQWQIAIARLFRILKPGGCIQITEVGHLGIESVSTELPATRLCDDYCSAIFAKRGLLGFDCSSQVPILMEEAGFVDVFVEDRRVPLGEQWGSLGIKGSERMSHAYRAFGFACVEEGGLGLCESRADVESVVEQARREWDDNYGVYLPACAITARKPL